MTRWSSLLIVPLIGACAAVEPAPLAPSAWQVSALGATAVTAAQGLTIDFAQTRVFGHTGCNRFTGAYTMEEGRLDFGVLATTRAACTGEAAGIETAYLRALGEVDAYRIERGTLVLLAGERAAVRAVRR